MQDRGYLNRIAGRTGRLIGRLWAIVGLLFVLAAVATPNRAAAGAAETVRIYLYVQGQSPVDVTDDYYVDGGQGYLGPNDTDPVVLDYVDDHVYDMSGNVIGYLEQSAPPS